MVSILSHQGNSNENYFEILSCSSQNGQDKNKCRLLVKTWKKRNIHELLLEIQAFTAPMEISVEVPQRVLK